MAKSVLESNGENLTLKASNYVRLIEPIEENDDSVYELWPLWKSRKCRCLNNGQQEQDRVD